jgi:flagellar basal-body rod protein FlgF
MQNPTYIALASQAGLERHMQAVANNLANMSTTGYKAERVMFKEYLNRHTGQLHWQRMSSVVESGTSTDMASGNLTFTGAKFDVGLGEQGFFCGGNTPGATLYAGW